MALTDVWSDVMSFQQQSTSKEKVGYPTQKPIALLDRIIKASSNKGDVVLDPFCGCATTLVAADRLQRQWVGCDLSEQAGVLIKKRIKEDGGLFGDITVHTRIPHRTDLGPPLTAAEKRMYKKKLYGLQEGRCNGCHTHFTRVHDFHMDHIVARTRGGTDHDFNFQLLCGHCNSVKGKKTQEAFMALMAKQRQESDWLKNDAFDLPAMYCMMK